MAKNCTSQAFSMIDTLIRLSPSHKNIARNFYLWFISWRKGYMPYGLQMGIDFIATESDCSRDTVTRFFNKYPYLVRRERRTYKTNRYTPQETFLHAMQFMDVNNILEKNRRQQKRWYMNEMRKDLDFLNENVGICNPLCPNLRPNPLLIPESLKSLTGKGNAGSCFPQYKEKKRESQERFIDIPERIDRMNLPYEAKLKLSMIPEGIFQSALDSARWKHAHGWMIRDQTNYVVGQAIKMAKKQSIWLDWPAYYSSLKKYEKGKLQS
jgi:hypothetical protein